MENEEREEDMKEKMSKCCLLVLEFSIVFVAFNFVLLICVVAFVVTVAFLFYRSSCLAARLVSVKEASIL